MARHRWGKYTRHWVMQRVGAVLLVLLSLWLIFSLVSLKDASYAEFMDWLSTPFNAVMMILFIIAGVHHSMAGIPIVAGDYIKNKKLNRLTVVGQKIASLLIGCMCIIAVLKVVL